MRIVFIGAVDFSLHCLQVLVDQNADVAAVFTLDTEHAGFHSDFSDLGPIAQRAGIDVHRIRDINDPETLRVIRSYKPDVIFVFGWSQLIKKYVLDIPRLGCIGTHPALLPKNRGRHPLIWALAKGLDETGLTFFFIDEGADTGDILWQEAFPITIEDDAATLYQKIKSMAGRAIEEFLPQLESGNPPRRKQDHSLANTWRKRTEKDGEIIWGASTMDIYSLIRALTHPYPGAHTYLDGQKVIVWKAKIPEHPMALEHDEKKPGMVLFAGESEIGVRTGDGHIIILNFDTAKGTAISVDSQLGRNQ